MSEAERDRLRKLQDDWLSRGEVQRHVRNWGWGQAIATGDSPTFADVRDTVLPAWEGWFVDFLGEGGR